MTDLKHEICIDSNPSKVFNTINSKNEIESWWTSNVQKENNQNEDVFGFNNHSVLLKIIIIKENSKEVFK